MYGIGDNLTLLLVNVPAKRIIVKSLKSEIMRRIKTWERH
jgi:hypothetical protein